MKIKQFLCTVLMPAFLLVFTACSAPSSSLALETPSIPPASSQAMEPQTQIASSAPLAESAIPFEAPENWQEPLPKGMVRGWYGDMSMGSGYAERYLFQEDGTFCFSASGYDAANRTRYLDGEWRYKDSIVHLTIKRKIVIEGGEIVTGPDALPLQQDIRGGQYVQVELPEGSYETIDLLLELVPLNEETELSNTIAGSIMLGDLQLYAKDGIDYQELLTLWEYYGSL